jgi:hypothetical protein
MTMAANLEQAAYLSYKQCDIRNDASTLITNFRAFIAAAEPIFGDGDPTVRPVGNWLVLMQALSVQMAGVGVGTVATLQAMNLAAEYLYRMCLSANGYQGCAVTTGAQRTALLAAWNANIGT